MTEYLLCIWRGYWWVIVPHCSVAVVLLFLAVVYYEHKGLRIILPALAAVMTALPIFIIGKDMLVK